MNINVLECVKRTQKLFKLVVVGACLSVQLPLFSQCIPVDFEIDNQIAARKLWQGRWPLLTDGSGVVCGSNPAEKATNKYCQQSVVIHFDADVTESTSCVEYDANTNVIHSSNATTTESGAKDLSIVTSVEKLKGILSLLSSVKSNTLKVVTSGAYDGTTYGPNTNWGGDDYFNGVFAYLETDYSYGLVPGWFDIRNSTCNLTTPLGEMTAPELSDALQDLGLPQGNGWPACGSPDGTTYTVTSCSYDDNDVTIEVEGTVDASVVNQKKDTQGGGFLIYNGSANGSMHFSVHVTFSDDYSKDSLAADCSGMLSSWPWGTNIFVLRNEEGPQSPDMGWTAAMIYNNYPPPADTSGWNQSDWDSFYAAHQSPRIEQGYTDGISNPQPYDGLIYGTNWSVNSKASKSLNDSQIELTKLRYHFGFDTMTNEQYVITRHFSVMTSMNSTSPAPYIPEVTVVNVINGTGKTYWETNDIIPTGTPLAFQLTYSEGTHTIVGDVADNVEVYPTKVEVELLGGSCSSCSGRGGPGGGGGGPGTGEHRIGSVELKFDLGRMALGQNAGMLRVWAQTPSIALYQPSNLQLLAAPGNTTPIYDLNGNLRQVGSKQCLVDIVTASRGYSMTFYNADALIPGHDTTTLISTNGMSTIVTWTVENPDSVATNRLRVTEIRGGLSITNIYSWEQTNNDQAFILISGNGLKGESLQKTWNEEQTIRTEIRQIFDPINPSVPVYQNMKQYQVFAWGEGLILDVVGTGSAALTNSYSYSGSSAPYQVTSPNGGTTTTTYNGRGLITYRTSTFEDWNNSAVYYYYADDAGGDLTGYGDNTNYWTLKPRCVFEYDPSSSDGGKSTYFLAEDANTTISCTTPGLYASPFADNSLITTNHYYPDGDPNATRLKCVDNPDGTILLYRYASGFGYTTNIVLSGQPNSAHDDIVSGTKTVTVLGDVGEMLLRQIYDIDPSHADGLLIAQDEYAYTDDLKRSYEVTHLDNTMETVDYDCCGISSMTDRNGVTTSFSYDDLKRPKTEMRIPFNILTTKYWDAAGNLLKTIRTSGTNITLQQASFDDGGRVVTQTNALNGVTSYGYSFDENGHRVTTTTYPDSGTQMETQYRDGFIYQITGTAVHPVSYTYSGGATETKLGFDGNPTSEWTKTVTDGLGRRTQTLYPDYATDYCYYNKKGQLWKRTDPDGVTTFYTYNAKGETAYTITAVADDTRNIGDYETLLFNLGSLLGGIDRISWTTNYIGITPNGTNRVSETYVWLDGQSTGTLVSRSETSVDGLKSWQVRYGEAGGGKPVTNSTITSVSGSDRTSITTAPDGSYTINTYSYGRLISSTRYDCQRNQIGGISYGYDAHGRQYQVTDARNGTTTYGYNNADQVTTVTTPNPGGSGASPQTTTTHYNNMLRPDYIIQPDNTIVYSEYLLTGELGWQYGSRTYPVAYGYDYAGRMQTMTNWSDFGSLTGGRVTTWNYDSQRGWLTHKAYDDGQGPTYTYTAAGRLQSRSWVRLDENGNPITTIYAYDNAGSLTNIVYSDSTPSVTNTYDRLGHLTSVAWTNMVQVNTYNLAGELLVESYTGGILNGLSITNSYDALLRRTNLTALASGVLSRTTYGYDQASRLKTVNDGNGNTVGYNYLANSPLVSQIGFTNGSTMRMTTTKPYDYLNRLTQISSTPSAGVAAVFNYSYNDANQRTKNASADGSYWVYQYDSLGQVTNGLKYFYDGTLVPGQQFGYLFDDIGNRKQTAAGGDASGANKRLANYSANNLNQITQRDYPGTNDVTGVALVTNSVTVNGQTAWRKGEYFWSTVVSNNTTTAQWEGIKVASGGTTNQGNLYVPKTPEVFQYDADGNLTNDGRWAYVWDAENRLIQMTVNTNVGPQYQVSFAYDPRNRRIQKLVVSNSVALYTNRFLYDGWNLVAILNPQSSLLQSFVWGSDLSGSLQGAGGVGGLLMANASGTNCFPAFDGNGNVMGLVNVADGATVASYAYGPFGELIQKTGAMADNIPFRFSTKYQDDESDLLYYGYRYYKQSTGTWPNRDPLEEKGGLNLYGFVGNDSLNHIDYLGLSAADVKNLEELARKITEQLTKECLRRNGGNLNNILSSIQKLCGCKAYLGCGEQAAALAGKLNNTKTDSKWKFYYETVGTAFGIHQFVVAVSDDPNDPQLILDAWGNCFGDMGEIRGVEGEDSGYSTTPKNTSTPSPPNSLSP